MNAANAPIASQLENERRAHEPSMEEILASIRKIIADDDALPLSRSPAAPRLFETNVTPFAPPPQPAPAREAVAPAEAPVDAEPPQARDEAPAFAAPAPTAATSEPASAEIAEDRSVAPDVRLDAAEVSSGVPEVQIDIPEVRLDASEIRLDASEMESFAEVGRELARLDAPAQRDEDAEQGETLRAALDAPVEMESAADASDDEVNPVPHEESYEEPFAGAEPAIEPERMILPEPPRFFEAARDHAVAASAAPAVEHAPAGMGAMLSAEANASVASAFQALSASVQIASAEAVDRHVRDMLRPMLKQWLDDNLPVMVERLVRAEIERVARGGR
ncbi:MAG: DUF2497 domain-containing protein [Rhodoblastus sp.]